MNRIHILGFRIKWISWKHVIIRNLMVGKALAIHLIKFPHIHSMFCCFK